MDIEGQYKMLTHFDQIITDTPLATSSMTVNSFKHREAWLHAVTERLRPMFASHGAKIPDKIRLTCGFPSVRAFSAKNNVWVNAGRMRTARMDIAR
jgi:hypothetical protein